MRAAEREAAKQLRDREVLRDVIPMSTEDRLRSLERDRDTLMIYVLFIFFVLAVAAMRLSYTELWLPLRSPKPAEAVKVVRDV